MLQGYKGTLSTTESLFYLLDTLPLFIAVATYVVFWPGHYIISSPKGESQIALQQTSFAP